MQTLCGRRSVHDEKYVTYDANDRVVLQDIPLSSWNGDAPDGRWFPCCKHCNTKFMELYNLSDVTQEDKELYGYD